MGAALLITKMLLLLLSSVLMVAGLGLLFISPIKTIALPGIDLTNLFSISAGELPLGVLVAAFGISMFVATLAWSIRVGRDHIAASYHGRPSGDPS